MHNENEYAEFFVKKVAEYLSHLQNQSLFRSLDRL